MAKSMKEFEISKYQNTITDIYHNFTSTSNPVFLGFENKEYEVVAEDNFLHYLSNKNPLEMTVKFIKILEQNVLNLLLIDLNFQQLITTKERKEIKGLYSLFSILKNCKREFTGGYRGMSMSDWLSVLDKKHKRFEVLILRSMIYNFKALMTNNFDEQLFKKYIYEIFSSKIGKKNSFYC
ncbi:hypothetical protein HANVADRAFT_3352 [Hanseniaspora valbyensis NRRL Y-1626]|uniref:Uncharacterized protein n=1 Tax=Hanseniaspora valbyensis NRRL Y-1626 TaxID=766949 RepID=A0A1B7TAT1_9ASCO|nr:hypothetical protein HANVADRAFT_3352 [Hanseniaspora valbyensis NRRL Y-1626]